MANFGAKPWTNPFGKMSIFRLFKLLVFIAQTGVFSFQNILKHIFLAYIPKKINSGKMANFGPEPWTNPIGKMSIFRLFELLVFIAQKGVFSFQNILKHIFLAYIPQKIKDGKMANFGPKTWTNSFRKMSIFRVVELLVFIAQKSVFSFQNIIKHIILAFIA